MRKFYLLLLLAGTMQFIFAQTPVSMSSQPGLSYTENFGDIANWTNGFATGIGANRFASVATNATGPIPSGTRITTSTSNFVTSTTGGVQKGSTQSPALQSIILLSTGSTDNSSSAAIDFFMDFTGVNAGTLSFDWASVNNSTGDRKGSLRVYASTDGTSFTEITDAQVLNFTNNAPTSGSIVNVNLPASFSGSATARLRFYYYNGTGGAAGSRPKLSLDNLTVTATGGSTSTATLTSGGNASEAGTPGSFVLQLSSATTSPININYNFSGAAGFGTDYQVSIGSTSLTTASGTYTIPTGTTQVVFAVVATDDHAVEASEPITLDIPSVSGYSSSSLSASISIIDNDLPPTVSVAAGTAAAEPSTNGTFVFTLSEAAPEGGLTIQYSLSGSAIAGSDYTNPGTSISVAAGSTTATLTLPVLDDEVPESAKNISLVINSVTAGYAINNGTASIKLADNDVAPIQLTGTYKQDFDSLANGGTENTIPMTGWAINETGLGARDNEQYAADNGNSGTGDVYSYGANSSSERALGTLRSGSLIPVVGAYFTNSTGTTIRSLNITFTGEQWRLGTVSRTDRLDFSYSTNATMLTNGTWTAVDDLDFITPVLTPAGAKVGNDDANKTLISYTITGLSIPAGQTIFIRWEDIDASGSDDGLAIDDLTVTANPVDRAAPVVVSLAPANGANNVASNPSLSLNFNEAVQKGSGNIVLKTTDGTVVKTINITEDAVTVSGSTVSFALKGLSPNTSYYLEIAEGAITDISGNAFAGFRGSSAWAFTTGTLFYTADFQSCGSSLADGFTAFSETGSAVWACTTFGRDPGAPSGSAPFPYGVQINGFTGGTNAPNVDWLISPSFDLTSTTYPLLSFWSRNAFNGLPLQLKISTDYTGGDPSTATWTDINGKFPGQASNVWTLSSNINLRTFRGTNVHFAFVYTSTDEDGARWTLDDIRLDNSPVPPPPSLTTSTRDIQFTFVASGSTAEKSFVLSGDDLTSDLTVSSTPGFLVSKDGTAFSSSITYTAAEASNVPQTVFVQFAPSVANENFTGTLTITTGDLNTTVNLKGTSIDPATTLEVVNWNIEWFGSPSMGPANDNQQEQNISTILRNVGADIFALAEVVSEERLARVVSQMPGYSYVISNFGSHTNTAANPPSALADAQKLAFVYKTSMFSNISTQALLSAGINSSADLSNPAYNYWSSGRFPYMLTTDVTLNCVTKTVRFILVHAKANTSPTNTSYARRKSGADTLYQTLNALYPDDRIIILGDFNDDLDQSITSGFTTTSWNIFTNDTERFAALTLPLSQAGKKSTVSYNDVIDHVVVSNEMQPYYMPSSATILSDVSTLVSNYGSTTTDHFPVFTRYAFEKPAAPVVSNCPTVEPFCSHADGKYTIPAFEATSSCGTLGYRYVISGATERSGSGNDASGQFNAGSSTITWYAKDQSGNEVSCTTSVVIHEPVKVELAPSTVCSDQGGAKLEAVPTRGSVIDYRYSWTVPQGAANPSNVNTFTTTVSGNYSVLITEIATGCSATVSADATINQVPVISLSSVVKCASDAPVTLQVTGGTESYQYQWTVPAGAAAPGNVASFSASVAGSYSVKVINPLTGCSTSATATLTVHQNPAVSIPDAFALSKGVVANTVYRGYTPASSLTLNTVVSGGEAPYNYTWSTGSNASSLQVQPLSNTAYTVTVTDANGCSSGASKSVAVMDVRGGKKLDKVMVCHKQKNSLEIDPRDVDEHLAHGDMLGSCSDEGGSLPAALTVRVAPNPSSSVFTLQVQSGSSKEPVRMRVFDLFGREIEKKDRLVTPLTIQVGQNYRPGIYFVEFVQGEDKEIRTLIKL